MDKTRLLELYESMRKIREFETTVQHLSQEKQLEGYVHTYAGQEAVAVGVISQLNDDDYIASTYRNHGHSLARNVDIKAMFAELFGKASGVCKGKGGSMHTVDQHKNMIGGFGIVAAGIPVAAGTAFYAQYKGTKQVSVPFFGDGAIHQGGFHEGMYLAGLWRLPVLFVNENNGYAETTALEYHLIVDTIADMAKNYRMPAKTVDGMNVFAVYEAVEEALDHIRSGNGPYFLECKTYRYGGQFEGDTQTYKPQEEVEKYQALDPLLQFEKKVVADGSVTEEELRAVDAKIRRQVEEALAFARSEPYPGPGEVYTDVYADSY